MKSRTARLAATATAVAALAAGLLTAQAVGAPAPPGSGDAADAPPGASPLSAPAAIRELSTGWSVPWGADRLPDGSALYTERDTHRVVHLGPDGRRTEAGTVPDVVSGGEGGLLGLAVSPHFADDAAVYVYHTAATDNRIARMTFDGTSLHGYEPVFTGIGKAQIHNGGRLRFGPDGYLYATTGDIAEPDRAQDPDALEGKILRLTPDGDPAPGNPFGTAVYSFGHRNAQGLAWDDENRLWSAELGQSTWDELNLIEPGANYGWPRCEGACQEPGMTDPVEQWRPAEASPSGLEYADGSLYMAALRGQRLWRIPLDGASTGTPEAYYRGQLGRLRTVLATGDGRALWLSTTNADRNAPPGTDAVHEVTLE